MKLYRIYKDGSIVELLDSSYDKLIKYLNNMTSHYESKGCMHINTVSRPNLIVHEFASESNGYEFALVVAEGIAGTIHQPKTQ